MDADTLTRDKAIASRGINGKRFKGLESDSWDTIDVCFPGPVGEGKSYLLVFNSWSVRLAMRQGEDPPGL